MVSVPPCPAVAIQGQVLFVTLERVHTGNIIQNVFVAHTMGGRYVRTVIYREQLIFLVISRCRRLKSLSNLFIVSDIRAGEIAALYWEDIDLDTGMLFVWLTLVKVGAEYIRQEPKTADNTRRLVMAFTLAACLKHSDFAEKPQRGK